MYHKQQVGDVRVFYREASPANGPVFRADTHRVIAPDLPSLGRTEAPPRGAFPSPLDSRARTVAP